MQQAFQNKIALISGGLGDIGRAIAHAFAEQGASIALGDLAPTSNAAGLVRELSLHKVSVSYTQVDVSDAEMVQSWIQTVEKDQGIPDLIIANAATVTLGGIHELTPVQWSRELRVNLDGAFFMTQYATSRLRANEIPGKVVFIGSWAAHAVHAHIPAYSVSKAGLRMLCKCMALELAPFDILVNEVAPGYVQAGLSAQIWEKDHALRDQAKIKVPVRRLITPDEVAAQVLHVCHPDNRHITGSTILMDGGLSLL